MNLLRRNSWARQAATRSAVAIAKLENTNPAPRFEVGIVKVRDGGRCQIAAYTRVVRLPISVVSLGDKRTKYRMANSRAGCTRSLIEVARVLVQ